MTEPVRVAFIGCGMMGQSVHLRNFLKQPECEAVAVCDVRRELAEAVALQHRIPHAFSHHQDLLDRTDCDAVVCVNHAHIHRDIAVDCLRAGKHVYVEKPMCMCTEDGLAMCAAAREGGAQLMVAHMKRYDPGFLQARKLLDEFRRTGELGRPIHARVHYFCGDWMAGYHEPRVSVTQPNPSGTLPMTRPKWMAEEHARPWWGFLQQFCHGSNALRFLWGDPSEIRYAHWDDFVSRPGDMIAVLRMDGFDCVLEAGAMRSHFWDEHYKLYFEGGWIKVSATPPLLQQTPARVEVYRADPPGFTHPFPGWGWAFENEARAFLECCRTETPPPTAGGDTIKDTFLLEQMYQSNQTGPVPLDFRKCEP